MPAPTDSELLTRFFRLRDESAFARLVERNAPLVMGAALRRLGDRALAEEVAQNVFVTLARKADRLHDHPRLVAWLQKAAAFESMRAAEKESNRRRTMDRFQTELEPDGSNLHPAWADAVPVLDEAMSSALSEIDREILLRRYWREEPFQEISVALGKSTDALEKRASRAVEKLGRWFRRRGIVLSSGAVVAGLSASLTDASAAGALGSGIASKALLAAQSSPLAAATGTLLTTTMKAKLASTGLVLAAIVASAGGGWMAGHSKREATPTSINLPETTPSAATPERQSAADRKAATARRDSLRRLLETAREQLLGNAANNAAKIQAAARLSLIDPRDLPAAMELLAKFDGGLYRNRDLAALLLEQWAVHDGAAACDFALDRMEGPMMGLHPVGDPLRSWSSLDPVAAMAWFQSRKRPDGLISGDGTVLGMRGAISDIRWIMGAWALSDAPSAAAAFRGLETAGERAGAIIGFREAAAAAEGRNVLLDALWEAQEDGMGNSRSDRVRGVLDDWATHDPADLAAWIDTIDEEKSNDYMVCKAVLGNWLLEDEAAAIDWWMKRKGGHQGESTKLDHLINAWAEIDVFGAAAWLAAQPLTETHVGAITSLSQKLTRDDPEKAFAWAAAVPDESARQSALGYAYTAWFQKAPEAARAALDATELSDEHRAALEKSTEEKPPDAGTTLQL